MFLFCHLSYDQLTDYLRVLHRFSGKVNYLEMRFLVIEGAGLPFGPFAGQIINILNNQANQY